MTNLSVRKTQMVSLVTRGIFKIFEAARKQNINILEFIIFGVLLSLHQSPCHFSVFYCDSISSVTVESFRLCIFFVLIFHSIYLITKALIISFLLFSFIIKSPSQPSYFFTTSANEGPPPHAECDDVPTDGVPVAATVKFSDSGFEDRLDLSSELESSVPTVTTVVFPEEKLT